MDAPETCPLPDDPTLAAIARTLNDTGFWAQIVDRNWRYIYITDALLLTWVGALEPTPVPVGAHYFSPDSPIMRLVWSVHAGERARRVRGSWPIHTRRYRRWP